MGFQECRPLAVENIAAEEHTKVAACVYQSRMD
jgi:hypothetical protein